MAAPRVSMLGELAVKRGLISKEELHEALGEFNVRRAAGSRTPIGEVLVELGYISRRQLRKLLEGQGGAKGPREQIPGFELIRKLGEGGMGGTFLARQIAMDRLVALKVLRKKLARTGDFVVRFRREAQLAGELDHQNIVRALDVGAAGGFNYLVMEYVEGRDLIALMPDTGGMPEEAALGYAHQIARALDFAHERGIVHRDVKPDNVLVTRGGIAKLCDFGLAKRVGGDTDLTQSGTMMGTPHYVSPEQARGARDVDVRSDIYSLGATLYHLVTGETPFSGTSAAVIMSKHMTEQMPWPQDLNPEVSESTCRLIEKMMAKDPADRYQTPAELLADIERVQSGSAPAAAAAAVVASSIGRSGAVSLPARREVRSRARRKQTSRISETGTEGTAPLRPIGARRLLLSPYVLAAAAAGLLLAAAIGVWVLSSGGGGGPAEAPVPEELAARTWTLKVEPLIREKYSPAQAARLLAALAAFDARHEKTACRRKRAEQIGRLKTLAGESLGASAQSDPSPAERAAELFRRTAEAWRKSPGDFVAAREGFREVASVGKGTDWAAKAADQLKQVEAAQARAGVEARDALLARASKLAADGDVDGALAALEAPPVEFEEIISPAAGAKAAEIRKEQEARFRQAIDEAHSLSSAGKPAEALARLEELAAVRYSGWTRQVTAMRSLLGKELNELLRRETDRRSREAVKLAGEVLDRTDRLIADGKFREAVDFVRSRRKAAEPEVLKLVAGQLDAAEKMAAGLAAHAADRARRISALAGAKLRVRLRSGLVYDAEVLKAGADGLLVARKYSFMGRERTKKTRVRFSELAEDLLTELLPSFAPRTPEDRLALAVRALDAGDLAAAGSELGAAGDHPLGKRYLDRVDAAKRGVSEEAAERAWREKVLKAAPSRHDYASATQLLQALDSYLNEYGTTRFARGRADEAARLRAAAQAAIRSSPEAMADRVRGLLEGRLVRFDPRTLQAEFAYDFEDARQAADWSGAAPGRLGGGGTLLVSSDSGAVRAARFAAAMTVTRLDYEAECERCFKPHAGWYIQTLGFASPRRGANCGFMSAETTCLCGLGMSTRGGMLRTGRRYRCSVTADRDDFKWVIDGRPAMMARYQATGTTLALATMGAGTKCHFDNVRIVGRLEKAWLTAALELFDRPGRTALFPEADAHVRAGEYAAKNFGAEPALMIKHLGTEQNYFREGYIRFDLSRISGKVTRAVFRLTPQSQASPAITHALELVPDADWSETTISWNNRPTASKRITTWKPVAGRLVEVDLTAQVRAALAGNRKLCLRVLVAPETGDGDWAKYASREAPAVSRPVLVIDQPPEGDAGP